MPILPASSRTTLLTARAEEAVERYNRDRWERFIDAVDVGELSSDIRVSEQHIADGRWSTESLFLAGDELFEHDFGGIDGYGPGYSRVHAGAAGGPDALSCAECHHRGGFDGAGDRSQNAFFDGNGKDPASAFERNPPHTLGLGAVERLAEEMTRDLQRERSVAIATARIEKRPWTARLESKGVSFGTLVARPDGSVDTSGIEGVDPDLVVKPFGWKGALPTIREFVIDGFQRHHGLQLSGDTPATFDGDRDGIPAELTEGMVTAVTAYLTLLEIPVVLPPHDPDLARRHLLGAELFRTAGCADCHVPTLLLDDTRFRFGALTVDLLEDAEEPRLVPNVYWRLDDIPVNLYSDLKRHDMGPALAEPRPTVQGIPGDQFLTRSLWGVADTAPYLHDGRAPTLDDAILLHGGEAQRARDAFARMSLDEKAALRIFLLSLSRYPRIEYR